MKIISNIRRNKIEVAELLMLAVALSTGVNLLSTYLGEVFDKNFILILACLIIVFSAIYIIILKLPARTMTLKSSAILSVNPKTNELLKIEGYVYNNAFRNVLNSIHRENKLFKEQWSKDPIGRFHNGKDVSEDDFEDSRARRLIKEITEYIYLDKLSTHLSGYFEEGLYDKKQLTRLTRDDVAEVIMSNRIIDLLTKNLDDRIKTRKKDFVLEITRQTDDEPPEVVEKTVNGIIYSKFELMLPVGSKISRNKMGGITISNKNMSLDFEINAEGFNAFVEPLFERSYMNSELAFEVSGITHHKVEVITRLRVKPRLVAFGRKSEYHQWAEQFMNSIDEKLSFAKFQRKIQWPTIRTWLIAQANRKKIADKLADSKEKSH